MPGKPRRLTAKQEAFAQNVASGMNQTQAYTAAYAAQNMAMTHVWDEASDLAKHPEVSRRIETLRAEAAAAAGITRETIIANLMRIAENADADGQYGPARASWMDVAQILGLDKPEAEKGQTVIPVGFLIRNTRLRDLRNVSPDAEDNEPA